MSDSQTADVHRSSGTIVGFAVGVVATATAIVTFAFFAVSSGASSGLNDSVNEEMSDSLPQAGVAYDGRSIGPMPASPDAERPDLVPAVDRSGEIVGYVRSDEIEPQLQRGELVAGPENVDVVGLDGQTVVGRMIAGVGFVSAEDLRKNGPTTTFEIEVHSGKFAN